MRSPLSEPFCPADANPDTHRQMLDNKLAAEEKLAQEEDKVRQLEEELEREKKRAQDSTKSAAENAEARDATTPGTPQPIRLGLGLGIRDPPNRSQQPWFRIHAPLCVRWPKPNWPR